MSIPAWINKEVNLSFEKYEDIPEAVFGSINQRLDLLQGVDPVVTILIAAYNEETNILRCIASLSLMKTALPLEIVVVNNNSSDNTQKTLDRLHVKSFFQPIQGCGPARQMGQENATGKYIVLADADCLYPAGYVDEMMKVLQKPGTACVYGRY